MNGSIGRRPPGGNAATDVMVGRLSQAFTRIASQNAAERVSCHCGPGTAGRWMVLGLKVCLGCQYSKSDTATSLFCDTLGDEPNMSHIQSVTESRSSYVQLVLLVTAALVTEPRLFQN
jgi:hypothetical protein